MGRWPHHRRAFTLVELLAVLVLMALIAAVTAVSLTLARRQAQMSQVVQSVEQFDRLTREHARRFDKSLQVLIQPWDNRLKRVELQGQQAVGHDYQLPSGYRIERTGLEGESGWGYGELAVAVSGQGRSPSYALLIAGPEGRKVWLLVAGMTGQVVELHDETQVHNVLRLQATGGDDPA